MDDHRKRDELRTKVHDSDAREQGDVIDFGEARPSSSSSSLTNKERIELETHTLRLYMAGSTLIVFVLINGVVLYGLHEALIFDFSMLQKGVAGYERFINTGVISSLLGATTIQLGAIMFVITKFFFPERS
jgi:hypothetical protein